MNDLYDKIPLVISMENIIRSVIETKLGFSPYNITYCCTSGLKLSITFYSDSDLESFCKFASITNLCDDSGFMIFREKKTILLSDFIVKMFNQKLMEVLNDEKD
jgi:hypothetical protein